MKPSDYQISGSMHFFRCLFPIQSLLRSFTAFLTEFTLYYYTTAFLFNLRCACVARVTVVIVSVCLCVCLLSHISPLGLLFIVKMLPRTKVKKFVAISLKLLCCRDRVLPPLIAIHRVGHFSRGYITRMRTVLQDTMAMKLYAG